RDRRRVDRCRPARAHPGGRPRVAPTGTVLVRGAPDVHGDLLRYRLRRAVRSPRRHVLPPAPRPGGAGGQRRRRAVHDVLRGAVGALRAGPGGLGARAGSAPVQRDDRRLRGRGVAGHSRLRGGRRTRRAGRAAGGPDAAAGLSGPVTRHRARRPLRGSSRTRYSVDAMPSTAAEVPDPPAKPRSRNRWGIVAAVSGLIGIILTVLVPLLPVTQTTSTISWPEGGTLDPVTAPLVAYYPLDLTVEVPCTAVQELRDQGAEDGVLVSTAPKEAGENAGARALTVSVAGPTVEVRSRNVLIASAPTDAVATPDACSQFRITAESASIGAEFEGLEVDGEGVGGVIEDDLRPQVVGVFSDLSGAAPDGMAVDITVDSRYTTEATVIKQLAIVVGILAIAVSLAALHRLDLRDGRTARRVLPRRWWKPRPLDFLVLATMGIWHIIGANTSDDGYILTEARAAVSSGYMPEVFRYFGAPYAPFVMPYYLYTAISEFTLSSVWLRLPALLLGIASWILLTREVIPRLGIAARGATAFRCSTAAVFLAFWLTYNNGLRPEPVVAFGVLATCVSLERALATGRLLPAAAGFIIGGLTLSAAPTGTFCIAAIIAASRPLLLLVIRRARRDGWIPTVAPLLAAGLAVLHLIFLDQPLVTTLQSSALLGDVGPTGRWFEESWRYEWLMNQTPDGSLARRFGVLTMFLSLITCAAILFRKGRIPGVAVGPARRIV